MITNLIMDVMNGFCTFESCLFLAILLFESFEYEILMYQVLTKYLV